MLCGVNLCGSPSSMPSTSCRPTTDAGEAGTCDRVGNADTYAWLTRDVPAQRQVHHLAASDQPRPAAARPFSQHRAEAMGHDLLPNPWESATGEHTISSTDELRSARQSRAARPVGHTESIDEPLCADG